MDVVWTVLGAVLIALTLRDIFEMLFHPLGRGRIGRMVIRAVASACGAAATRRPSFKVIAGPLSFIAVVATWATLLIVGWALVFFPHLPEGFRFAPGLDPSGHSGFDDALYVSLVNLTSLGYGDISPESALLRIMGPVEALFGLGLLTASVSWLISIQSVVSRRDAFAHEVRLTRAAEGRIGERLADADPELLERMLASYTEQLVAVRRDLMHFPITYWFRGEDDEHALSSMLPFLRDAVAEARSDHRPLALKVRARMLEMAIDDFAETLRDRLQVPGETTEATLRHYQRQVRARR
ncbi:MAG: potassium channel family protein [Solirubrobacterales bacterium]